MHYFITGHTGFKGSWLVLLLKELGHQISGYSIDIPHSGLFELAGIEPMLLNHFVGDVRDASFLKSAFEASAPDVAIHLAAQPLVLRSYENPLESFTTNVDGTRNFLDAATSAKSLRASLVITTDKVYKDLGTGGYREDSPLGGKDPYSASKSMADILTQSYIHTFPHANIRIARAGNVVGSYDVSENRLIPDIVRSVREGSTLIVRNPQSVRPWQHVLDCLAGYIEFIEMSLENPTRTPPILNFGPDPLSFRSVQEIIDVARVKLPSLSLAPAGHGQNSVETIFLTLDSSLAHRTLSWRSKLNFEKTISMALEEAMVPSELVLDLVQRQIVEFLNM